MIDWNTDSENAEDLICINRESEFEFEFKSNEMKYMIMKHMRKNDMNK
jgi:hypothetical protein